MGTAYIRLSLEMIIKTSGDEFYLGHLAHRATSPFFGNHQYKISTTANFERIILKDQLIKFKTLTGNNNKILITSEEKPISHYDYSVKLYQTWCDEGIPTIQPGLQRKNPRTK